MIYDSTKINDAAHINSIVINIRSRQLCGEPAISSVADLKRLVICLNFKVCERFLDYSFALPYVPWKGFKGMTSKQMIGAFSTKDTIVRNVLSNYRTERVRVLHTELTECAKSRIARPVGPVNAFAARDILVFENGTILDEVAPSVLLYNPRAILIVVLTMAKYYDRCNEVLELIYNSVCRDDEWLLPMPKPNIPPSIPLIAIDDPSEVSEAEPTRELTPVYIAAPVASQEAQEGFDGQPLKWGPADGVLNIQGPSSEPDPEPASTTPQTTEVSSRAESQTAIESALAAFVKALKPGTEIRIVVPA